MRKALVFALVPLLAVGCNKADKAAPSVQTAPVDRRDIVVDAEATGVVEPINVVEVKSKASGQITQMSVETGSQVKPGDLLVQVDTRDVRNQYNQALADVRAAEARTDVVEAQRKRAQDLFAQRIITAQEHETALLDYANAQAQLVRTRASLDLAQQRLDDATVRAPVAGTIIEKTVSLGQVITSATGSMGAGTTLLKMADLNQVRVRALVNESDIGNIRPGQQVTVTVDAYPERPFQGVVEKIEPQAVVQQSVTMFPVLVSVSNREGLLKPGMNGEVSVLVERRPNVLAIPNDAVRSPREATVLAPGLGLDPDAVQKQIQSQMSAAFGPAGAAGTNGNGSPQVARGDVALADGGVQQRQWAGGQVPDVTPQQCDSVRVAFERNPSARATLDSIRDRTRSGALDGQQARTQMQAVYTTLKVDPAVARACMRPTRGDAGAASATAPPQGATQGATPGAQRQRGVDAQLSTPEMPTLARSRTRSGLVFVAENGTYTPRMVRLGVSNYDYTEVVDGLKEGEQVVLLAAVTMQQQRQQSLDQIRQRTSMPGMGGQPGGATPRPGGRP